MDPEIKAFLVAATLGGGAVVNQNGYMEFVDGDRILQAEFSTEGTVSVYWCPVPSIKKQMAILSYHDFCIKYESQLNSKMIAWKK